MARIKINSDVYYSIYQIVRSWQPSTNSWLDQVRIIAYNGEEFLIPNITIYYSKNRAYIKGKFAGHKIGFMGHEKRSIARVFFYKESYIDVSPESLETKLDIDNSINEMRQLGDMPNGCMLYVKDDMVGGRDYWSDEVGGGVHLWSTSLVDKNSLLAAIVEEERLIKMEDVEKQKTVINKGALPHA